MYVIYIIKLIFLTCNIAAVYSVDNTKLSNKRSCADKECSVPISEAKTLQAFASPTPGILSFKAGEKVTIYSKEAGENTNLWGGEINGKRGYVFKKLVREDKILIKGAPTLSLEDIEEAFRVIEPFDIKPASVKKPYEVIDGTTLYTGNSAESTSDKQSVSEEINAANVPLDTIFTYKEENIKSKAVSSQSLLDSIKAVENASLNLNDAVIEENKHSSSSEATKSEQEFGTFKEKLNKSIDDIKSEHTTETVTSNTNSNSNELKVPENVYNNETDKELGLEKPTNMEIISTNINANESGLNTADTIHNSTETKENSTLNEENANLNDTNTSLNDANTSLNEENTSLKDEIPSLNEENMSLNDGNTILNKEEATLNEKQSINEFSDSPNLLKKTESYVEPKVDIFNRSSLETVQIHNETESTTSSNQGIMPVTESTTIEHREINSEAQSTITKHKEINPEVEITNIGINSEATIEDNSETMQSTIENNILYQKEFDSADIEDVDDDFDNDEDEFSSVDDELELTKNDISAEEFADESKSLETEKSAESAEFQYDSTVKNILKESDNLNSDEIPTTVNPDIPTENLPEDESGGFFSNMWSNFFSEKLIEVESNEEESLISNKQNIVNENSIYNEAKSSLYEESGNDHLISNIDSSDSCSSTGDLNICHSHPQSLKETTQQNVPSIDEISNSLNDLDFANFFDIILVLSITGGTTAIFFIAYLLIDKCRREGPLIAKINQLEKALLVSQKEIGLLAEKNQAEVINTNYIVAQRESNQEIEYLQLELQKSLTEQTNLQDQVLNLEKELENSTEVGLELNKMISDMLSSQNGSDVLTLHVEQLQNQLVDQHNDIAKYKEKLNEKTTEIHELQLDHDINKKKVNDLQTEIDSMLINVLKLEEERDENKAKFRNTLTEAKEKLQQDSLKFNLEIQRLTTELQKANSLNTELNRSFEIKLKELDLLKDSMKEVKAMKSNSDTLKSLLDMSSVKAELHQLKTDNVTLNKSLQTEQQKTYTFEKQAEIAIQEAKLLKVRFDEADKERVEAQTKLEVLGSYFKEKEGQLQKELSKHESMWNEKQGEASSTVERIKFMQEELQNYKSQNETLKHEIMSQEIDLKSQISVLEKKSHEYWLNARQVERKLEDAKQEAAQLRNRLTMQERSYMDDKPNGTMEHPLSPLHHMSGMDHHNDPGLHMGGDATTSPPPPLLYGGIHRDHMAASPHNLHNLPPPPPFLQPPMFMPPPPMNGPPPSMFMPPPPLTQGAGGMFGPPGDHRPPPLGRISSPPIPDRTRNRNSDCFSPSNARTYSPYDDRHTPPSPSYDDYDDDIDDDDMYNNRREGGGRRYYENSYRPPRQMDSPTLRGTRNGPAKGSTMSSGGSAHSNTSAEKGNV